MVQVEFKQREFIPGCCGLLGYGKVLQRWRSNLHAWVVPAEMDSSGRCSRVVNGLICVCLRGITQPKTQGKHKNFPSTTMNITKAVGLELERGTPEWLGLDGTLKTIEFQPLCHDL